MTTIVGGAKWERGGRKEGEVKEGGKGGVEREGRRSNRKGSGRRKRGKEKVERICASQD